MSTGTAYKGQHTNALNATVARMFRLRQTPPFSKAHDLKVRVVRTILWYAILIKLPGQTFGQGECNALC